MHTRAAAAIFDAKASNKIVTGKVTSDRSMSRPFPTAGTRGFVSVNAGFLNAQPRHGEPAEYITNTTANARHRRKITGEERCRASAWRQNVWPGRAVQDGLPRSTNVRAASMYQASEVEQFASGHHGYPRLMPVGVSAVSSSNDVSLPLKSYADLPPSAVIADQRPAIRGTAMECPAANA